MESDEKRLVNFACDSDFHLNHSNFLDATNLLHGANGFTSLLKEGFGQV
jgi:hypothetical protein